MRVLERVLQMDTWSRRKFLANSMTAVGGALVSQWSHAAALDGLGDATPLGTLDFLDEFPKAFHTPFDSGLEGRLITDLRSLSEESLVTPTDHFFIRTRTPDQIDWKKTWTLTIQGLVKESRKLQMNDILGAVEPQGDVLLECSGNNRRNRGFGLLSSAHWDGVLLTTLLKRVIVDAKATGVLVHGVDTHSQPSRGSVMGASWVFTFEQLEKHGAFLATHMNGQRLPRDHGFPIRLIVPGWYGCSCIKWVDRIELIDDSTAATSQMLEFSTRTHQTGRHPLAKDYAPATMDQAAMPIRVDKISADGRLCYFVTGVMWGGDGITRKLSIRFAENEPWVPVNNVVGQQRNETWGIWQHPWSPSGPGRYDIVLKVDDPSIRTRRLDVGYYRRSVHVDEI
jgi:DMSO/TMAO reductase YedYZ molybdopterin-dependent catalytic subunit